SCSAVICAESRGGSPVSAAISRTAGEHRSPFVLCGALISFDLLASNARTRPGPRELRARGTGRPVTVAAREDADRVAGGAIDLDAERFRAGIHRHSAIVERRVPVDRLQTGAAPALPALACADEQPDLAVAAHCPRSGSFMRYCQRPSLRYWRSITCAPNFSLRRSRRRALTLASGSPVALERSPSVCQARSCRRASTRRSCALSRS